MSLSAGGHIFCQEARTRTLLKAGTAVESATLNVHSIVCLQFLSLITCTCNVSEGIVDLGDHLVFRYFLPQAFLVTFLVNKSLIL